MSRWGFRTGLVIVGLSAGCGGGDSTTIIDGSSSGGEPTTTTRTITETPPPTPPAAATARANEGPSEFVTPSGNIGCFVEPTRAGCQIAEVNWQPPAPPPDCPRSAGAFSELNQGGPAFVQCGMPDGGPDAFAGSTLGYGELTARGAVSCLSEEAGITCENADTGHGFFLARESFDAY